MIDLSDGWVCVKDRLPANNQWVLVFEDDNDNPIDAYHRRFAGTFFQRVQPARLKSVDSEGYANWYLCVIGGSHVCHVRNVTHWKAIHQPGLSEK